MKLSKSRVSLAVAAAIGIAGMIPTASFGYSIDTVGTVRLKDPADPTKTIDVIGHKAGTLNNESSGDALIFPFYTTYGKATTSFSVTNTSEDYINPNDYNDVRPGETILAKIRFREQDHSMEVLDFYVVLSPGDKFDFVIGGTEPGAKDEDGTPTGGRPRVSWAADEDSCVVVPNPQWHYATFKEHLPRYGVLSDEQMAVGHLEVLGLVNLRDTRLAAWAKHGANGGSPPNCKGIRDIFQSPEEVNKLNKGKEYGTLRDAGNWLVGRYVVRPADGVEGGANAIALRDTNLARLGPIPDEDPDKVAIVNQWYVTSQNPRDCHPVSLTGERQKWSNCRVPWNKTDYGWATPEWTHPHLGEMENLYGFHLGMQALALSSDWSNKATNNVGFDWIVSFPYKYVFVDYIWNNSTKKGYWVKINDVPFGQVGNTHNVGPDGMQHSVAGRDIWPGDLSVYATLDMFDYDEGRNILDDPLQVSPGAPVTRTVYELPREVNVVTVYNTNKTYGTEPVASMIQSSGNSGKRVEIGYDIQEANRGWGTVNFVRQLSEFVWGPTPYAVTGLNFTIRARDNEPGTNYGSLTEMNSHVRALNGR